MKNKKINQAVETNKVVSTIEWLINDHFGDAESLTPLFKKKIKEAKEMEIAGKEMSYAEGYSEGYKRALELIEWMIKLKLKEKK